MQMPNNLLSAVMVLRRPNLLKVNKVKPVIHMPRHGTEDRHLHLVHRMKALLVDTRDLPLPDLPKLKVRLLSKLKLKLPLCNSNSSSRRKGMVVMEDTGATVVVRVLKVDGEVMGHTVVLLKEVRELKVEGMDMLDGSIR